MEGVNRRIKDLLESYKEHFLKVSIVGPYKDGEQADELYKWQLITTCQGKSTLAILESIKDKNIVDVQRVNLVLSELIKYNPVELVAAFETLTDEKIALIERLESFKQTMAELCGDKYKVKANDERTAAAFLACVNPAKYTFYKDEIYQKYCNYIGEKSKPAGEKYQHYLEQLQPLLEAIKKDKELTDKYEKETKGLTQSDILIAQNILWQMKDMINQEKDKICFWSGGIKWGDGKIDKLNDFNKDGYWKINWDKNSTNKGAKQAWNNISKVKEGDFLSFHGFGGKNDLRIYQISRVSGKDEENGRIYFEKISFDDNELFRGKAPKMEKGTWFGTLFPIIGAEAIDAIFGKILNKIDERKKVQMADIDNFTKILSLKKNLILQGAPGTGKTYNTAALALSICGVTEVNFNDHVEVMKRYKQMRYDERTNPTGQIAFSTFHQSMDYEDFVEGIKPNTDGGTVTYDVEDGIFKLLSDKAKENYENSLKTIEVINIEQQTKDLFEKYCFKIENELSTNESVELYSKSKMHIRKFNRKKDGSAYSLQLAKDATSSPQGLKVDIVVRDFHDFKEGKIKSASDVKPSYDSQSSSHGNAIYYFELYKRLAEFEKTQKQETVTQKTELQNYVLIIDEINRGNVSKIFGELITLLEADKRIGGEHPIKVTLPYSKEEFGVPSNLYIIGTMNTTDRSVGNIDYAVRRRFAFVTLESKREIVAEKCGEDSKAVQLFDVVKEFLQSHKSDMDFEDLMVGHSYFMADNNDDLQLKLDYEIVPLIREYYKDGIINVSKKDLDDAISNWNAILKS